MSRALVVFGGAIEPDGSGGWRSARTDRAGVVYPAFRIAAAALLQTSDPHSFVIVSGGRAPGERHEEKPSIASVVRQELAAEGIGDVPILEEDRSVNTFQGLENVFELAMNYDIDTLTIVSNEWAIPRIKAMVDILVPQRSSRGVIRLQYVPAEDALLRLDGNRWGATVDGARTSVEYAERVRLEEQGVRQLRDGTYNFSN